MNLLDLPDEMLLCILNQFHAVDALCALSHLHPRLDSVLLRINGKVTKLILTPYAMERLLGTVTREHSARAAPGTSHRYDTS